MARLSLIALDSRQTCSSCCSEPCHRYRPPPGSCDEQQNLSQTSPISNIVNFRPNKPVSATRPSAGVLLVGWLRWRVGATSRRGPCALPGGDPGRSVGAHNSRLFTRDSSLLGSSVGHRHCRKRNAEKGRE